MTFRAISLTDSALLHTNYHTDTLKSLKALTCLDWQFTPVNRKQKDTLYIEFDILWSNMTSSGESGRINMITLYRYPAGGADFNDADSLMKTHPFGRPAYHIRVRNSSTTLNKGFIGYGGGNDSLGRLYIHDEWTGKLRHWLAGAVPPSGTGTYPASLNSSDFTITTASATRWKHFTWIIEPEKQSFYHRYSSDSFAGPGALVTSINIPEHSTENPPYYHWFDTIEAFRIYFNGNPTNTYFANLKISLKTNLTNRNDLHRELEIVAYPVPATNYLNISGVKRISQLEIISTDGKVLYTRKNIQPEIPINIAWIEPGVYFLRIISGTEIKTVCWVKQ